MKWIFAPLLTLVLTVPAAAQVAPKRLSAPASVSDDATYILGPNDEIEITVYKQPDMSIKTRIKADGSISVPFLRTIQAAGKTTSELAGMLAASYSRGGYLNNPSINVEVTTYGSKTVTVLGAVETAGLFPLDRKYSVAEMVGKAGGTRPDGANAVILSPADGSGPVRISLLDMSGAAGRQLQPGDSLFVPAAEQVFVYGEVNKGGGYPFQPAMTFRQALALAGGTTLAGSSRKIQVRRAGKKIAAELDDLVQPNDVLYIREKLF